MSATATAWVWKHSPYRNGALNVHAALADTANDLNDNQIWFSVMRLAAKARCGRSTVLATQARMLKDNLLEVVAEQRGPASPTVYRLLFPADAPVVYEDGTSPRTKPVQQSDQSKKGHELVQLPDSCPITEHKEPNSSRTKKTAHELTVLAMEQPTKPAGKNAFPKALGIITAILEAGHPAGNVESAIRTGGIVWSIGGLEMALQKCGGRQHSSRNVSTIDATLAQMPELAAQ
jgi:hypothetical protein